MNFWRRNALGDELSKDDVTEAVEFHSEKGGESSFGIEVDQHVTFSFNGITKFDRKEAGKHIDR